ncbi:hypothetical protein SAMN05216276_108446 [Streptosporangium subroseum]|uniref:Uncharacterized protein n=1 Tax=Streptosporangium subroseum TaxID=106412 RepID=A0A239P3B2_9ACTN|nr:hypothetical protein SAMN05216276_108446 [Streptosporangium subroseum]
MIGTHFGLDLWASGERIRGLGFCQSAQVDGLALVQTRSKLSR